MSYSFNLLDRPWIPCITGPGTIEALSIRETLTRAHDLRAISHHSPLVPVSVLRVLLAILHRVHGPKDAAEWTALWEKGKFEPGPLDDYFSRWYERFELLDGERPFYQDPCLGENFAIPVSKLMHEAASGNNATLFDHSLDDFSKTVPVGEAALQLVAHQVFALGGLGTPDPAIEGSKSANGAPTVKAALCIVHGGSLFETLLLNLRRYDLPGGYPFGASNDVPAWERGQAAEVCDRIPTGWVDLLTWQSRRIRLFPEGESATPTIRRVAVLKGESVDNSVSLAGKDSMFAWQKLLTPAKNAEPWIPLGFREDRALWRDTHSLFARFSDVSRRPPILEWISELREEGFSPSRVLALQAAGICSDQAKVMSWHTESLPLSLTIVAEPRLCAQIRLALDCCEAGEFAIKVAVRQLAERLLVPADRVGGEKKSADKGAVSLLASSLHRTHHYWGRLRLHFQHFISDLEKQANAIDPDTGEAPSLAEWRQSCRHSASEAMRLTWLATGEGERTFRAVAEAEAVFQREMNKRIPNHRAKKENADYVTTSAG